MGRIIYFTLVQLLLFATGTSVVAVVALAARRPKRWTWYALVKLGIVITNGILLAVVIPVRGQTLPFDAVTAAFSLGVAATGIGLVGVCRDIIRKAGSRSAFGDPKGTIGVLEVDEGDHDTPEGGSR
jgi:hypothetical protein